MEINNKIVVAIVELRGVAVGVALSHFVTKKHFESKIFQLEQNVNQLEPDENENHRLRF